VKKLLFLAVLLSSGAVLLCSGTTITYVCDIVSAQLSGDDKTTSGSPPVQYVTTETQTYNVNFIYLPSGLSYSQQFDSATATGSYCCVTTTWAPCNPTWSTNSGTPFPPNESWFSVSGQSYLPYNSSYGFLQCNLGTSQTKTVLADSAVCTSTCPNGVKSCGNDSPIILDLNGKGYILTDIADGVVFDIAGNGHPVKMGWTAKGSDNAFLVLPGLDGLVHSGKEMFGNFTPQPSSEHPNGFAALAVYDQPDHGGNGDGKIDAHDAIFSSLRLWIDENHDGICQREELHTLPSLGVNSISLHYQYSPKVDQYGNQFRYKAEANPDHQDQVDRTLYDVFFLATNP
jgi:hypothetical protein